MGILLIGVVLAVITCVIAIADKVIKKGYWDEKLKWALIFSACLALGWNIYSLYANQRYIERTARLFEKLYHRADSLEIVADSIEKQLNSVETGLYGSRVFADSLAFALGIQHKAVGRIDLLADSLGQKTKDLTEELNSWIEQTSPRILSSAQKVSMFEALKSEENFQIAIQSSPHDTEAVFFARQLANVLESSGWEVEERHWQGTSPVPSNLILWVKDTDKARAAGLLLFQALEIVGHEVKAYRSNPQQEGQNWNILLQVGPKPI